MRRHQSGMTLMGFMMVAVVVCFFLFILMKLFPMYQEFYAVKSAIKGLAAEADIGSQAPEQIKEKFFKRMFINNSETIQPENVKFENKGNGQVMYVNYEVRVPMVYNLDVVGKFNIEEEFGAVGSN